MGFGHWSCSSLISGSDGGTLIFGVLTSRMSAPPEKAFAEPMMTTAFTAGSAPAFLMPSMMPGLSTLPRPLTGGLFRVMTATPSRTEYEAASLIAWRSPGGSNDSNLDCGRGKALGTHLLELSLGVTFAVLGAALFHASWNAMVKSGGEPLLNMAL